MTMAVWPLGEGVVMVSHAKDPNSGLGIIIMRAVRDEFVGNPGDYAEKEVWDACHGAPELCISFPNIDTVDRHISLLLELRAAMSGDEA